MEKGQYVKSKIYDEMFTKINAVIGGKFDPKDFAEDLAYRIVNLECQISSLSDIQAKQENEIDDKNREISRLHKLLIGGKPQREEHTV